MNQVITVFYKELVDGLRDKRSVFSALLFPLLGPILVMFLLNTQAERRRDSLDIDASWPAFRDIKIDGYNPSGRPRESRDHGISKCRSDNSCFRSEKRVR